VPKRDRRKAWSGRKEREREKEMGREYVSIKRCSNEESGVGR